MVMSAMFPHELRREPVVQHRIEGDKAGRHRVLGRAEDEKRRDQIVAAFKAARWAVTTHQESYVRLVAGADHDRQSAGRGKDRE